MAPLLPARASRSRTFLRRAVIALAIGHGALHLIGVVKAIAPAAVPQLREPVGPPAAAAWSTAALLCVAGGVLLARRDPRWWAAAAAGALLSQGLVVVRWSDTWAATAPNAVLLLAAGCGWARDGRLGLRARFARRVEQVAPPADGRAVVDRDLAHLPLPVQRYLRRVGVVGAAHVHTMDARLRGQIRADAAKPWMPFTARQVNTFTAAPSRFFLLDATMAGVPVDVLHEYTGHAARMRGRLASVVPLFDARGRELTRSETVTLFNDMCVLAPATLVDAAVSWHTLDDRHVRATWSTGGEAITAELVFDADGDLVDFASDDRMRASADGRTFTRLPWSTPLSRFRGIRGLRLPTYGEARWRTPDGDLVYLEIEIVDVRYNVDHRAVVGAGGEITLKQPTVAH
ncbi:MAG TPA: DUF6544 family protein [Jatrophihabitans sp.]|jgi:hypothetical protein|uniref:DUF6544 family protein n=1 Tax=Jatrophihabitans sp. TaxID=1932789 RepID=UPI002DFA47BC|nr:DUF6544 family protein [Jatrophihabitans sp.]